MSEISVKNLSFSYGKTPESTVGASGATVSASHDGAGGLVLDDISFDVEKGDYIAILGSNGSGKSTLAKIICGFLGEEERKKSVFIEEGKIIGIVFQDPKYQIISGIVCRDTAFGPENLGCKRDEVELRTVENLNLVGLLHKSFSTTNELSLGQTQKLAIAGISALHPDIFVFDEATSMLDPDARADIINFLDFANKNGKTILHITHDAEEAKRAGKILKIEGGKIAYFSEEDCHSDRSGGIFVQQNSALTRSLDTARDDMENHARHDTTLGEAGDNSPALIVKNLSFSYPNAPTPVFENVNFSLPKGSLTAITGESGAGKSTLLEIIAGLIKASSGEIYSKNRPVLALQESDAALFERFVADDVAFGPKNQGLKGKALVERVKSAMEMAGIPYEKFGERETELLSGGEKRKVTVAAIIAMDSDVLLFDEPTAAMDAESRAEILVQLKKLARLGKTVFFSTHRMEEADFSDNHFHLHEGKFEVKRGSKVTSRASVTPDIEVSTSGTRSFERALEGPAPTDLQKLAPLPSASLLARLRKSGSLLNSAGSKSFEKKFKNEKRPLLWRIPPTLKYILFFAIFIPALFLKSEIASLVLLAVSILYALLARYPLKKIFLVILKLSPWLLVFCALQVAFLAPPHLPNCIRTVTHAIAAVLAVCAFIFSTGEKDLLEGFSGLLMPLKILHIPCRSLVVMMEIIFRFIPLLVDEACSIIKTQLVRGGLGKAKGLWAKVKIMFPLFVPLLVQTIKRAASLAQALTARYF